MIEKLGFDKNLEHKKARSYGLFLLARRDYATSELREKINTHFPQLESVDLLIEEFLTSGWLSDERYIESYIHSKSGKCFGPNMIRYELQRKGVSDELIEQQFDTIEIDWIEKALMLLKKRLRNKEITNELLLKQKRYLYQRGFTSDQIEVALDCFA